MDMILKSADAALRTLLARPAATQHSPGQNAPREALSSTEAAHAGALMRVNHVGEVCAQALYAAQALGTRNVQLRRHFEAAGAQERDHLAWTAQRLQQLHTHPSRLNPLWYAGAFGLGLLAARWGDAVSLGFVAETERQVGAHLQRHLQDLPAADHASRAIVSRMHADELQHARAAVESGAQELPAPAKTLMRIAAKVMTTVAYRL